MKLAFDTSVLIELDAMNPELMETLRRLEINAPSGPMLPSPVISEYYYGFLSSVHRKNALENLKLYDVLNTTRSSSLLMAELSYKLEKSGRKIPEMDMLIASICIDNGTTLVTFDRHFLRIKEIDVVIPGLRKSEK
ncbi:MAG TPA: PIN domain-containing protein [archaeon]|nr:PIN domain-containing protein [archaeon]